MAHEHDVAGVDLGRGLKVIERPAQAPGPGADGAPLVGGGPGLARLVEEGLDAVLEAVVVIGVDVSIVGGRQRVASGQNSLDRPARRLRASRSLAGAVVDHPRLGVVPQPLGGKADPRVLADGMVTLEVQAQEGRHATARRRILGQIQQEVDPRAGWIVREEDRHLAADRLASQRLPVFRVDRENGLDGPGRSRRLAIDVGLEQPHDFRPARGVPSCRGRHLLAVGSDQGIGQRVEADLALIVIGVRRLGRDHDRRRAENGGRRDGQEDHRSEA